MNNKKFIRKHNTHKKKLSIQKRNLSIFQSTTNDVKMIEARKRVKSQQCFLTQNRGKQMYKDAKPAPNAGVPYLPTGDSGD